MVNKYLVVLALGLAWAAGFAQSHDPRASDLRSAIRQTAAAGGQVAPPRQLTEQQRAELRRQLSQYSRLAVKGS